MTFCLREKFEDIPIKVEYGSLTPNADYAVKIDFGGTVILANLVIGEGIRERTYGYFPVRINYYERYYAYNDISNEDAYESEKINFREEWIQKFIEDSITPEISGIINNDVLISLMLTSYNKNVTPEIPTVFAVSLLLAISGINFKNIVSALRIGLIEGKYIINPDYQTLQYCNLDILLSCTKEHIINFECNSDNYTHTFILGAIGFAKKKIADLINIQQTFIKEILNSSNNKPSISIAYEEDKKYKKLLIDKYSDKINNLYRTSDKENTYFYKLYNSFYQKYLNEEYEKTGLPLHILNYYRNQIFSELIVDLIQKSNKRLGDRTFDEFRKIQSEVDILPNTHGSAKFQIGKTQVYSAITLDWIYKAMTIQDIRGKVRNTLIYNIYSYPFTYSRADKLWTYNLKDRLNAYYCNNVIKNIIPNHKDYPYTTRIVNEILSSEGISLSSSINASVLALKAGGVKIKIDPVSIDLGVIIDGDNINLIVDPLEIEMFGCDLYLNVIVNEDGFSGIKVKSISSCLDLNLLEKIFLKIIKVREFLFHKMNETISEPREKFSQNVPVTGVLQVSPESISRIIGSKGKNIFQIVDETNTRIEIEEDGLISILSKHSNQKDVNKAKHRILDSVNIARDNKIKSLFSSFKSKEKIRDLYEIGDIITAEIVKLVPFGVFVRTAEGNEGPIYLSELGDGTASKPEDVVKVGDELKVVIIEIDGFKMKFSHKKALEKK